MAHLHDIEQRVLIRKPAFFHASTNRPHLLLKQRTVRCRRPGRGPGGLMSSFEVNKLRFRRVQKKPDLEVLGQVLSWIGHPLPYWERGSSLPGELLLGARH